MAQDFLQVRITTPLKKWELNKVISITAPGVKGSFQVLFNHAPLLSQIEIGEIKLVREGQEEVYATSGGFLEVLNNKVSLLLESCENARDIDVERAQAATERARQRLKEQAQGTDISRAEVALARALNRIRVAGKVK